MNYFKNHLWKIDLALAGKYSFGRAYSMSLRNRPPLPKGTGQVLTYGETPLSTFQQMLSWIEPFPPVHFAELGCGTGRLSLMLSKAHQSQCTGVDLIQPFVDHANRIAQQQQINCVFLYEDILALNWSAFDLIYITSTTYSPEFLSLLWRKCATLPAGVQMITLTHAPPPEYMKLVRMEVLPFSWGVATVYLTIRSD